MIISANELIPATSSLSLFSFWTIVKDALLAAAAIITLIQAL